MTWLQHTPTSRLSPARGARLVRRERRVNFVLTVVRDFLRHGVDIGAVPPQVLSQLYRISDVQNLPAEVRGEGDQVRYWAKPRHRLREPDEPVDNATDEEVLPLLRACHSARDRLIIVLPGAGGAAPRGAVRPAPPAGRGADAAGCAQRAARRPVPPAPGWSGRSIRTCCAAFFAL